MEVEVFLRKLTQLANSCEYCECGCVDLLRLREYQRSEADRRAAEEEAERQCGIEEQRILNGDD